MKESACGVKMSELTSDQEFFAELVEVLVGTSFWSINYAREMTGTFIINNGL